MKPVLTNELRAKIKVYIKNNLDISPLIRDYSVAGEDLTGAIIEDFNRPDEDISGIILANAVIGKDGVITNLNRVIAQNCNFRRSVWKGTIQARKADCRGSSMTNAKMPDIDYKYADFRGCDFCGTVFQISTAKSLGALFDESFFKDLAKYWGVNITIKKGMEDGK